MIDNDFMRQLCHVWNYEMRHDPIYITMQARELVEQHGESALSLAQNKFYEYMNEQNLHVATIWLSIIHEVQAILRSNANIN